MRTTNPTTNVTCALLCAALLLAGGCARAPAAATTAPPQATAPAVRTAAPAAAGRFDAQVAQLRSNDFEVRTRAARALVAAGDAALPALGRAGRAPVSVAGDLRVSSTRSVIDAILAREDDAAVERALQTEWAVVRRGAATELGRRDRWDAIPSLIVRLEDRDADVRHASGAALRRLTNNFFGFRAQANLGHRRRAAGRWRSWWSSEGRVEARERAARMADSR